MSVAPPNRPTIQPQLILPFAASARLVLETMLSLDCQVGAPHLRRNESAPQYDDSGIISFSGQVVGTVVIGLYRQTAVQLVDALAGAAVEPESADFVDALGELTNMIVGGAKKDLGVDASISVPTVIMGRGHVVARPRDVPCLVLPCQTAAGDFSIEISIKAA